MMEVTVTVVAAASSAIVVLEEVGKSLLLDFHDGVVASGSHGWKLNELTLVAVLDDDGSSEDVRLKTSDVAASPASRLNGSEVTPSTTMGETVEESGEVALVYLRIGPAKVTVLPERIRRIISRREGIAAVRWVLIVGRSVRLKSVA